MKRGLTGPRTRRDAEGKHMNSTPTPTDHLREHSEAPSEGTDGEELTEIRMHSEEAAEGPDDDSPGAAGMSGS